MKSPMKYMLDTNICIYAIKRKPQNVLINIQRHDPSEICISSITYAELIYGIEKSQQVERNRLALSLLLSGITILDFDDKAANCSGQIRAFLERSGAPIGPLDTLIAGHAKSLGYTLVTNNTKEFSRIPDLFVENWSR